MSQEILHKIEKKKKKKKKQQNYMYITCIYIYSVGTVISTGMTETVCLKATVIIKIPFIR